MRKTSSQLRRERETRIFAVLCLVVGSVLFAATFIHAYRHDARIADLKAHQRITMTTAGQDMGQLMESLCKPLQGHMARSGGEITCTVEKAPQ